MDQVFTTLTELERLADQYAAVRRYLEVDHVDVSLVTRAERNLREEAFAALAVLARGAEQALVLDELVRRADQLKLGANREERVARRCEVLVSTLCEGDERLARTAWSLITALADLGRVVWALRLVDSMLQRCGPECAVKMVERVRKNVLRPKVDQGPSWSAEDRTIQLGSKLALQRILSSPACLDELKPCVTDLLVCVRQNLDRIDRPHHAAEQGPVSRRQTRLGPDHDQLMMAARPWEEQAASSRTAVTSR